MPRTWCRFTTLSIKIDGILTFCAAKIFDTCTRMLHQGFTSIPDTFYWSITTVLGGADKAPVSIGGKVLYTCDSLALLATLYCHL